MPMYIFDKNNINSIHSKIIFMKIVEYIDLVIKNNGIIFGGIVYEYLWPCCSYGLEWDKYDSVVDLIANRGLNSIYIADIDVAFKKPQLKIFKNILKKCYVSQNIKYKSLMVIDYTFLKLELIYHNPFSDDRLIINTDISWIDKVKMTYSDFDISNIQWDGHTFKFLHNDMIIESWLSKLLNRSKVNLQCSTVSEYAINKIGQRIFEKKAQCLHPLDVTNNKIWLRIFKLNILKNYTIEWTDGKTIITINSPLYSSEEKNNFDCAICRDTITGCGNIFYDRAIAQVNCEGKHKYHLHCISKWVKSNTTTKCPLCRSSITDDPYLGYKNCIKKNDPEFLVRNN